MNHNRIIELSKQFPDNVALQSLLVTVLEQQNKLVAASHYFHAAAARLRCLSTPGDSTYSYSLEPVSTQVEHKVATAETVLWYTILTMAMILKSLGVTDEAVNV
jgi:hypothetical protein